MKKLLIILLLPFVGCGIIDKVDEIIYPTPEVDSQAKFRIYEDPGTRQIITITTIQVDKADKVFWYYGCKQRDLQWNRKVHNTDVAGDKAIHKSPLMACWSTIHVRVVVYNRWQKKGQKAVSMEWRLNIKELLQ